jgi:Holliday junction resolvase RusA-like endonuclease
MSASDSVQIVLLGQPRGKERPRGTKDGHFYTPEKTRSYEAALKYAAQQVMGDRAPMIGPLGMNMRIIVPIAQSWSKIRQKAAKTGAEMPTKKPDIDNVQKMLDALNLIVWVDDAQIVDTHVVKRYGEKPGLWVDVFRVETGAGVLG